MTSEETANGKIAGSQYRSDTGVAAADAGPQRIVQTKVRLKTKLLFGIGQVAEAIKMRAFEMLLLFYYTQVLGLSGTMTGMALFLAMCADAITDPLIGSLSDNFKSKWGRRHPFMYAAALPFALTFYFVFAPPGDLTQTGLFLWLTIFSIAARASITLFIIPYYAVGAEITDDYQERTSLVSFRNMSATIGQFIFIFVAFSVFFAATPEYENGQLNPDVYPSFAATFAIAAFVVMIIAARGTHDQISHMHQTPAAQSTRFSPLTAIRSLVGLLRNRPFRAMFLGSVVFFTMSGVTMVLRLHVDTFFWELRPVQIQNVFLCLAAGTIIAIPCVKTVIGWLDKRETLLTGIAGFILFQTLPPALRLLGFFPENGTDGLYFALASFSFALGFSMGLLLIVTGSMSADVADDHELKVGLREEGMLFGFVFFAMKTASGLGKVIAGTAIDFIQFPIDVKPGEVPAETLFQLGLLYGPGIGVLAVIAFFIYAQYDINRYKHQNTLYRLGRQQIN